MDLHPPSSLPPVGRASRPQPSGVGVPISPTQAPHRLNWPGKAPKPNPQDAEIARKFETLIAETLLRSARAASLGDDGLGNTGANIRDMVDHQRAEAIARAAPLGVARLLQAESTRK